MDRYKTDIIKYYNSSQWLYNLFWDGSKVMGLHFGFWKKKTKSRQEAIINQSQEIIKAGKIKKNDYVLDAGCGIGGTAIYMAKKTGCKVAGITLSPVQLKMAQNNAKKFGVSKLVKFWGQDYTKTKFNDESFDVIFGLESICYASPKSTFLNEAFRLLKPGGRLIISDGYLARKPRNEQDRKTINTFCRAWELKEFIEQKEMIKQITTAGFKIYQTKNNRAEVIRSVESLFNLARRFYLPVKILKIFNIGYPIVRNYEAAVAVKTGIDSGLFGYWTNSAIKPV